MPEDAPLVPWRDRDAYLVRTWSLALMIRCIKRDHNELPASPFTPPHPSEPYFEGAVERVESREMNLCYFVAESFVISATASCTVVMNCAGKMMVEFLSIEISAIVWRVRS